MGHIPKCRFEDLLRGLTVEKADICEAMTFALDNAECAFEVGQGMPGSSETSFSTIFQGPFMKIFTFHPKMGVGVCSTLWHPCQISNLLALMLQCSSRWCSSNTDHVEA